MQSRFQHIALIGKYHAPPSAEVRQQSIAAFSQIAGYIEARGGAAYLEQETANFTGMDHYPTLSLDEVGRRCDLAIVLGGDGTMLGVGRELAKYNTPLVGINQGRLGFVTDIPLQTFLTPLSAILAGHPIRFTRCRWG